MIEKINLLTSLNEFLRISDKCIFTTYSFQPYFFENYVIRKMNDPSVENVSIIIDNKTYYKTFNESITSAGCNYSLSPIVLKKNSVFHPKVFLMKFSFK